MVTGVEILIPKLVIIVVAGMAAWGFVRDFLAQTIIPAIRDYISSALAEAFATLIKAIDDVKAFAERKFVEAFNAARQLIRSMVLGAETIYRKLSADRVSATTTIYVPYGTGAKAHTIESEMPWYDVPPEVREAILQGGSAAVRSDLKAEIIEAINKKVPKELLL